MMKKVSVIIPAYNKAELTVESIESVLSQTYKNIEIIVVDDGSTDNTRERLLTYSDKIKYIYKKNSGACSARNLGIRLSSGEYIAFLDCDDKYLPKKIELSVDFLENNSDFGFVYTSSYFIDERDNILREYPSSKYRLFGDMRSKLLMKNFIPSSTVVVRKSCFDEAGFFDEAVFIPADWDMWLRLSEKYQVGFIDSSLTMYRVTGGYLFKNLGQAEKEEFIIFEKAFQRNPNINNELKNRVISNIYLRSAINYLLTNKFYIAKNKLVLSICKNSLNIKTILIFASFLFARYSLRNFLIKKMFTKNIFPS